MLTFLFLLIRNVNNAATKDQIMPIKTPCEYGENGDLSGCGIDSIPPATRTKKTISINSAAMIK